MRDIVARRFLLLIAFSALGFPVIAQAQVPASADGSSEAVPQNSIRQNTPCMDQPRSRKELVASFQEGRLPLVPELTGTWVEIGDTTEYDKSSRPSLNCSGIKRGSKFEFVLIANGYSVELHAIGMTYPQKITMEPNMGSVEFPEVDFGGEGTLGTYRCRLTKRGTLACLISSYGGAEFKKMAVEKEQIYDANQTHY
jgi:hypothetical protein